MSDFYDRGVFPPEGSFYRTPGPNINELPEQFSRYLVQSNWKDLRGQWQELNNQRLKFQREQAIAAEEQFNFCIRYNAVMNQIVLAHWHRKPLISANHYNCWTQSSSSENTLHFESCPLLSHPNISRLSPRLEPTSAEVDETEEEEVQEDYTISTKSSTYLNLANNCVFILEK